MLEESVIYQDIFQKGEQRGQEKEAKKAVLRMIHWLEQHAPELHRTEK